MKPAPFDYLTPTSVDETLAILREHEDDAKLLAGGQSLVPLMSFRLARPDVLVDANSLTSLTDVRVSDSTVTGSLPKAPLSVARPIGEASITGFPPRETA